ncbi:hypothetical protein JHK82_043003 [Glycine max]|nr:hypothetical protein JHK82_043003 [Glycine max]
MAETIDEDAQSINNPFLLELFKEGNSSGVMLDLDKGTWNVVKMEGTLGDIHTTSHALDIQSERKLSSLAVQNSDPMKTSQLGYLTVKTGKEKGRRRKRKSLGVKLAALCEVSSSQGRSGSTIPKRVATSFPYSRFSKSLEATINNSYLWELQCYIV